MQNFVFHNPTKIIFGKNTIGTIGSETVAFGEKTLLVYGSGSIKDNGIYTYPLGQQRKRCGIFRISEQLLQREIALIANTQVLRIRAARLTHHPDRRALG